METDVLATAPVETLQVTLSEPAHKHSAIFQRFDALLPGENFCIVNDHDPKSVYYQLIAERGHVFTWRYEAQGPQWWKVVIQKNMADEGPTVGDLAAADVRDAAVFKKYGLDFCCGGKKSLKHACEEKGLCTSMIEQELREVSQKAGRKVSCDFNRWQLDFLTDYIYNEHHQYWYNEEPEISQLVNKVTEHHGKGHPELLKVNKLYSSLRQELNTHFMKEERVLFPHIRQLARAKQTNTQPETALQNIAMPLQMMEAEHEAAGELLRATRKETNDYTLPAGACNSYRLLYHKLLSLEEDLHQHIHLENNILFPKGALLHKEFIR